MTHVVVVGAGVAGLSAAREALSHPKVEVTVLEAGDRPGGLVETERTPDGFLVEHGPDSLVTTKPAATEAARAAGLDAEIVRAGAAPRRSFVVADRDLVPLPPGLVGVTRDAAWSVLRSPLLSWRGRARAAAEPWVPARRDDSDESVHDFFERRFGREMADRLVEPVLGSVYNTPTAELSLRVAMPRLADLERRFGSVAAGLARTPRTVGRGPAMVTFARGMASLPEALARGLGDRVRYRAGARSLERRRAGWTLRLDDGGALDADAVVLATPAWASAPLLEPHDPELAALLGAIAHSPLTSVSMAWRAEDVPHPMDGTGFVVPPGSSSVLSACTWTSRKWPGRAPDGFVLIRAFLRIHDFSDSDAVAAARADLRELMGIEASPRGTFLRRRARSLPRAGVGHLERVARMGDCARALGGLALAGNSQGGVGIPDCIESGVRAARDVLARGE